MDAGDLVPDEVTIGIVRDRLAEDDAVDGFLLDGFPRTVPQAEALHEMLDELGTPLDAALELQVDDDEVVRRLVRAPHLPRAATSGTSTSTRRPSEGVCDTCGGELFQRDDDQPETVRRRLEVFNEQTAPLVGFYADLGLLGTIPRTGKVDEITERAIAALDAGSECTPMFRVPDADRDQVARAVRADARGRARRRRGLELMRDAVAPGITTGRARRDRCRPHPDARRNAQLPQLPRLPGHDLRVGQRRGRAWHPGDRVSGRRPRLARLRGDRRGLARRRCDHRGRRPGRCRAES